jgi:uncharacterized membrane protein HdeD (DUF308 family)
MSDLICPHCRGNVPRGATVCRGCQAEIEYGVPGFAFLIVAIVSAYLGVKVADWLPESLVILAWIAGIACFVFGGVMLEKAFGDRVEFKRIYRTK